jgi:hypothetical protein
MACLILTSCASWKRPIVHTEPPAIDCSERTPAEPSPAIPRTKNWLDWSAYARRWQGVAIIEVGKRAEVADCLDRERAAGRIR